MTFKVKGSAVVNPSKSMDVTAALFASVETISLKVLGSEEVARTRLPPKRLGEAWAKKAHAQKQQINKTKQFLFGGIRHGANRNIFT
jgi:hypothetical protein